MPIVRYKSGNNWVIGSTIGAIATTTTYGFLRIAKDEDVEAGTDNGAAVTARQIKEYFDDNTVHKSGNEIITGNKTFTGDAIIEHSGDNVFLKLKNTSMDRSVNPSTTSENSFSHCRFLDNNNSPIADLYLRDTATERELKLHVCDINGNNRGNLRVGCDINNVGYVKIDEPAATDSTTLEYVPTIGWVNNPEESLNVVHRSGNETIDGTKYFNNTIIRNVDLSTAAASGVTYLRTEDSSNKGRASLQSYYTNSQVYNRISVNNLTADKYGYLDVIVKDTEEFYAGIGGNGTNLSLTKITNTTSDTTVPTMGWVNNPATATNVVHISGNETITGQKTFNLTVKLNQIQSTGTGTESYPHINFVDMDGGPSNGGKGAYVAIEDGTAGQWNKIATVQGNNTFTGVNTFNQTIQGTAYRAQWGDLAEYYKTDKQYPKGTLVQFGGEKEITIATNKVNAIITSEPGFILNSSEEDSQAIALIGRVPVRVIGKVKKFDKIALSYIDGVGCVSNDSDNVIGIALENKMDEDESLVLCSVKIDLV